MKSLFEQMGGTYILQGDYYLPDLVLPAEKENRSVGIWGQRHRRYLKNHHRVRYINLLTSGKPNAVGAEYEQHPQYCYGDYFK